MIRCLSVREQLFDGCGHCTGIGRPGSTTRHKLPCGIYKPVGGETTDFKILFNGIFLCFGQVIMDGVVSVKMILSDESAPCVLGTVVAEIEIDNGLAFQHLF